MAIALTGENYTIQPNGALMGDRLLDDLLAKGFIVKLFTDGPDSQAGLEDSRNAGTVPEFELLWRFADMQDKYTKELRLRQPLLNRRKRKGK